MSTRIFTLDEARSTMPLVRRIAQDLQQTAAALAAIPAGMSYLYSVTELHELPDAQRAEAQRLREQIEALAEELVEIGALLKGVQPVLVDFPSVRDGEEIFLCWALGEDDVSHWHTPEGGFRSRQQIL